MNQKLKQNQIDIDYWTKIQNNDGYDPEFGHVIPKGSMNDIINHLKDKRKKLINKSFKENGKY